MNCNKCGAMIAPGSTNCPNCGEPVVVQAQPEAPVTPVEPQAVMPSAPVMPQAPAQPTPEVAPAAVMPSAPVAPAAEVAPAQVMPSAPVAPEAAPAPVMTSAPAAPAAEVAPAQVMPSAPVAPEAAPAPVMTSAPAAPAAVMPQAAPQVLQNGLPVNGMAAPAQVMPQQAPMQVMPQAVAPQAPAKKSNGLVIIIIVLLILIGVAAGLYFSGILRVKTNVTTGTPTTNATASADNNGGTTTAGTTTTEVTTTKYTTTTQVNNLGTNKQTLNGYTFTVPTTFTGTKDKNNGSQLWMKNDDTYLVKLVKIGSMSVSSLNVDNIKTQYSSYGYEVDVYPLTVEEIPCVAILYEISGVKVLDLYYEIENGLTVYMVANVFDTANVTPETVLKESGRIASSAEKVSGSFASPGKMELHDTKDVTFTKE